jgi:hypothetical protein
MFHMEQSIFNRKFMGCGENCACSAGEGEILEAKTPDGKDITEELKHKKCENPECKEGKCESCSAEGEGGHGEHCAC